MAQPIDASPAESLTYKEFVLALCALEGEEVGVELRAPAGGGFMAALMVGPLELSPWDCGPAPSPDDLDDPRGHGSWLFFYVGDGGHFEVSREIFVEAERVPGGLSLTQGGITFRVRLRALRAQA